MKWRFLGPKDFEWMLDVSKEHHKESDWSEVEYSEDKVKGYITTALKDPNILRSSLKKTTKELGFYGWKDIGVSFSKETFARELDLYVEPKHRNGMAGIFMMKKFIEWSTVKGVREVLFEPRLSDGTIKKI